MTLTFDPNGISVSADHVIAGRRVAQWAKRRPC
jgi:hypothetical protein